LIKAGAHFSLILGEVGILTLRPIRVLKEKGATPA